MGLIRIIYKLHRAYEKFFRSGSACGKFFGSSSACDKELLGGSIVL
jgi:hypothetical protein